MLRGAERGQHYKYNEAGQLVVDGPASLLQPGDVEAVGPGIGDIHVVSNAHADQTSISIHVYGGNIGAIKRHVYNAETGEVKDFVSGYSNDHIPNIWDRSAEVRAEL